MKDRVPPGQIETTKWPVLHYGSVPRFDPETWDFRVEGLVESPLRLNWKEFNALPRVQRQSDFHCVTRWSRFDNRWDGVAFKEASFDVELFTNTVQQLQRDKADIRVLTGNDRFVAESYRIGAHGALIGVANVATEKWGALDIAGRAGKFDEATAIQRELESVKELVFSEPIVEAVARIKAVLHYEGLIKTATVRRPQLGISEAELKLLLDSYRALKRNEFRAAKDLDEAKRREAVG